MRLRKNDEVIVITGSDKGKRGTIKTVQHEQGRVRVIVEGVGLVKKHIRGNPNLNTRSTIQTMERPLDISNVAIYNSSTGKADGIRFKRLENGRKVRVFKSNDEQIDAG